MKHALLTWLASTLLALPVAAQQANSKPRDLFNGTDLTGWKTREGKNQSQWVVGRATLDQKDPRKLAVVVVPPEASGGPAARLLINRATGVDLYTEEKFGDCIVEVEFMIPRGSNSGIYLMGEYEVQIFDSFGKKEKLGQGDMGAIYSAAAPKINACNPPGQWQNFVIHFQAPKFKDGKKVANARFLKVILNGKLLHENVEVAKATPGGLTGKEAAKGPLMFQGDHGPIAFRSVKVTPK